MEEELQQLRNLAVQRWSEFWWSDFNFNSGRSNGNPNVLSQQYETSSSLVKSVVPGTSVPTLLQQARCPAVLPSATKLQTVDFPSQEGVGVETLRQLHKDHGHQDIERTTELIRQRCYWPGTQCQEKYRIAEHQARLIVAFEGAWTRLSMAADCLKQQHDQRVHPVPLQVSRLVYLRDHSARGRHKIQDLWSSVAYQVFRAPQGNGAVYTIAPVGDLDKVRHLHCDMLKGTGLPGAPYTLPKESTPTFVC